MGRIRGFAAACAAWVLAALIGAVGPARASGDGEPSPWYVDQFGGERADVAAFFGGRVGVVMARAPASLRLAAWRLLHGLPVGPVAGAALSGPCCDVSFEPVDGPEPVRATAVWKDARLLVTGALAVDDRDLDSDRPGPNFTDTENCWDDAFVNAAATLKDRVARAGAASPFVAAWLATQDAVFRSCGHAGVSLPTLPADSPTWLRQDRAYQEAAFDLYDGRPAQAAARFAAIGRDPASPWRDLGPYLTARALLRAAIAEPTPDNTASARAAIDALAATPTTTYGHALAADMLHVWQFHFTPAPRMAEIEAQLRAPQPPEDIAVILRDDLDLAAAAPARPEIADWMMALAPTPSGYATGSDEASAHGVAAWEDARVAALRHARERWTATKDVAWLIAALSLADPGEPAAAGLIADATHVPSSNPGWLTAQYHLTRLTLAGGDAQALRARLDAILARTDLSVSDRNLFTAQRMQVASDLREFARLALRRRLCGGPDPASLGCLRSRWQDPPLQAQDVFDGEGREGVTGLGQDALAVIDRLPLRARIALSHDPVLPARLRMDIALTNFTRAVQLRDDPALDGLARDLSPLLPQLAAEWARIPTAKPGPDKRFAAFMVLAKIPGLRTDLADYVRPRGTVAQFQRHWMDWVILPAGARDPALAPPAQAFYQVDGFLPFEPRSRVPDGRADLTCLGECGRGASPVHLPDFVARLQPRAVAERGRFVRQADTDFAYDDDGQPLAPSPTPPGALDVWEDMLAYAHAHPADPRIPEALHWIVHASHFGASHAHSGRRAFQLLHRRYPDSVWARRTLVWSE